MNTSQKLDANVLGQLLLMQSVLGQLPDKSSIFSFICRGLEDLPGVVQAHIAGGADSSEEEVCLPIREGNDFVHELRLQVNDMAAFAPYKEYLKNFCFMVGVILEERLQRQWNEQHQRELEEAVLHRTEELAEKERQIRMLLDSTAEAIIGLDETGSCSFVNRACLKMLGYIAPEQVMGKNVHYLIHPSHPDGTYYELADCPVYEAFFSGIQKHGVDQVFRRADGSLFPVEYWAHPVLRNGRTVGAVITFFDITDRKQAEADLQLRETRFQDLTERSLDWIWEFDEHERFTYVSPRVKDLLGYDPDELLGTSAFDLMPMDEREKSRNTFDAIKEERRPFSIMVSVNQHKDGRLITLESSGVPVFDSRGVFRGYRGINRDISERKEFEDRLRQSQKMEAVGLLAGGVAHDFNNILTAILGFAEMAEENLPEWSIARYQVQEIIKAGARAKGVIKQILAFSRKSEEKPEYIECRHLVSEVLNLLRATLPSTIEIRQELEGCTGCIYADASQIHQVILNICTNAAQAMDESGGLLSVFLSTYKAEADCHNPPVPLEAGRYVELTISDTGPGINPDIVDRIFDPYFTTKEVGQGSGMGLAVVLGIVENLGGAINVDNVPGDGASITIYFPEVDPPQHVPQEPEEVRAPAAGSGRILVVDDEEVIADLTRWRLESMGYEVYATTSSHDALKMFRAEPDFFDAILTDQTMPNMTGTQLATAVMEIRPDIPVILCSGYSAHVDDDLARQLGIRVFLLKPVERTELAKAMRQALGSSS